MSFLHPEFIYLMLPLLLVLFALLLTQSEGQEQFVSPQVLAKLRVDTKRLSSRVRNLFYLLMFLFIILALAAPVIEKGEAKVKVKGNLFFVALDLSNSMRSKDVYPNRLEEAKQKVLALLNHDSIDRIGLIAFAESSYLVAPPTMDHLLLSFLIKPMTSTHITDQGTNIFTLLKAADQLLAAEAEKKLLIISDGGECRDFAKEIAFASKNGIKVSILGIGTDAGGVVYNERGAPIKVRGADVISRFNSEFPHLATESGGVYVRSGSGDIAELLSSLGAKKSEIEVEKIYFHFFVIPIALAMLMLLIATSSFHLGEKYYLPAFITAALLLAQPAILRAEIFGFRTLDKAKEAYESGDYRASSSAYKGYALQDKSAEAAYNAANSYYRMGRYATAARLYQSVEFAEAEKNHQLYHNLGNALAKLGDKRHLAEAVEAYKKALKFREDSESLENLERVEKALQTEDEDKRASQQPASAASVQSAKSSAATQNSRGRDESAWPLPQQTSGMSDREAAKWLKMLAAQQRVQKYRIKVDNPDEGADDEKRW
ncbi:MAG: VWA domain-containing protein [Thiovulaceae bacterium]|nr:VWA domain-containing protein [Sulfurimonadaceae bacterium]